MKTEPHDVAESLAFDLQQTITDEERRELSEWIMSMTRSQWDRVADQMAPTAKGFLHMSPRQRARTVADMPVLESALVKLVAWQILGSLGHLQRYLHQLLHEPGRKMLPTLKHQRLRKALVAVQALPAPLRLWPPGSPDPLKFQRRE
ncbi:MAG: hypothetical protein ACT4PG_12245 [Panacagrimonas sp.]